MVKAYFDYSQSHVFGVANKNKVKSVLIDNCLWMACGELVIKLSPKSSEIVGRLDSNKQSYVSTIEHYQDSYANIVAIGYEDGDISLFSIKDLEEKLDDERFRGLQITPLSEQLEDNTTPLYYWAAFVLSGDWR